MKRFLAAMIACVMLMFCLCACSKGPVSLEKGNTHNAEEKTGDKTDEALAEKMQPNKYSNVKRLVSAHDDVIIFKQREAYGLMSLDGEIICSNIMGIKESANFEFDNNYMLGFYGDEGYSSDVQTVIDKKGNTVLSVGKDNVEFISKITQGRIFVHQMTGMILSGKTYDVICYSAKNMSEVFRLSGHNTISIYALFNVGGYSNNLRDSSGHDVVIDIYGNEQEQKWGYIDPYGNWKIEPQYDSVNTFSYDGYAVVDQYKVINTKGETILDISKGRD